MQELFRSPGGHGDRRGDMYQSSPSMRWFSRCSSVGVVTEDIDLVIVLKGIIDDGKGGQVEKVVLPSLYVRYTFRFSCSPSSVYPSSTHPSILLSLSDCVPALLYRIQTATICKASCGHAVGRFSHLSGTSTPTHRTPLSLGRTHLAGVHATLWDTCAQHLLGDFPLVGILCVAPCAVNDLD